ncbi:bestrophin-like domain [Prauserella cavernicola]|uniref:DUF4239 domain-containing protein n=1 Tax=Prauserella cavernicola TaxID=2800127 RepID=A0A934V2V1_9PSEU|nr:DUF4239 domain-containing protein [Prauserella cavernicola]MBK1782844.1 DUF4239 domain-containing protein [Prauserella cavernicola]
MFNVYIAGLLWVAGAVALGAGIAFLVRRIGLDEGRPDNNEAAGQVFTIVGGLQAVLVSFVLISLFDGVTQAGEGASTESHSLVAMAWAADALPEPARSEVLGLARDYTDTVIEREWPQLQREQEVDGPGWTQLDELRAAIAGARIDTGDEWEAGRKAEAQTQLVAVYEEREARVAESTDRGLGPVVWFVLGLGSFITVVLSNLFGGTKLMTHMILVTTLAGMIMLLLFAIYQLQNPFGEDAKLGPEAFELARERLG